MPHETALSDPEFQLLDWIDRTCQAKAAGWPYAWLSQIPASLREQEWDALRGLDQRGLLLVRSPAHMRLPGYKALDSTYPISDWTDGYSPKDSTGSYYRWDALKRRALNLRNDTGDAPLAYIPHPIHGPFEKNDPHFRDAQAYEWAAMLVISDSGAYLTEPGKGVLAAEKLQRLNASDAGSTTRTIPMQPLRPHRLEIKNPQATFGNLTIDGITISTPDAVREDVLCVLYRAWHERGNQALGVDELRRAGAGVAQFEELFINGWALLSLPLEPEAVAQHPGAVPPGPNDICGWTAWERRAIQPAPTDLAPF